MHAKDAYNKILIANVITLFYGKAHMKKYFVVMDLVSVRGGIKFLELLAQRVALRSGLFGSS